MKMDLSQDLSPFSPGKDIPGGGYKQLAEQTGASRWQNWAKGGVTRRTVTNHFGRAYHQAAQRASKIHFSLDGIDDVAAAIKSGKRGFVPGNMTNAELEYICRNPEILNLKKTIFYRNAVMERLFHLHLEACSHDVLGICNFKDAEGR